MPSGFVAPSTDGVSSARMGGWGLGGEGWGGVGRGGEGWGGVGRGGEGWGGVGRGGEGRGGEGWGGVGRGEGWGCCSTVGGLRRQNIFLAFEFAARCSTLALLVEFLKGVARLLRTLPGATYGGWAVRGLSAIERGKLDQILDFSLEPPRSTSSSIICSLHNIVELSP